MNYLYNDVDLAKITYHKKRNLYLSLMFFALFVISLVTFIIVSSYKTKLLFSILASVIGSVFIFFAIMFLYMFLYYRRLENEYNTLLISEEATFKCEVLEQSDFLTTLPDKSRCYEVMVKIKEDEKILYLSEIFSDVTLVPGKCQIAVSFDYIKGYKYED